MLYHDHISAAALIKNFKNKLICLGGNKKLMIYGTLRCKSGKRMKKENRVFFASEEEALKNGYRPCGHCMKKEYKSWKYGSVS
jgi:methylphosphotriester-DNA--protein-cysteine methyltransferase